MVGDIMRENECIIDIKNKNDEEILKYTELVNKLGQKLIDKVKELYEEV